MANRKLKKVVLSSVIAGILSYSLTSYADDMEIYLKGVVDNLKPNLLFIIDRSLEMNKSYKTETSSKSQMQLLKEGIQSLMLNAKTKGLRVGVISFGGVVKNGWYRSVQQGGHEWPVPLYEDDDQCNYEDEEGYWWKCPYTGYGYTTQYSKIDINQPVVDIDEIDRDKDIKKTLSASGTTLEQTILTDGEDAWQTGEETPRSPVHLYRGMTMDNRTIAINKTQEVYTKALKYYFPDFSNVDAGFVTLGSTDPFHPTHIGLRFNNILLKRAVMPQSIKKAVLKFYGMAGPVGAKNVAVQVAVDTRTNSPNFHENYDMDLVKVISGRPMTTPITCKLMDPPAAGTVSAGVWQSCDITELVRGQVAKADWQAGNAITVIMQPPVKKSQTARVFFRESGYPAKLEITADNGLITENRKRNSEKIIDAVMPLTIVMNGRAYLDGDGSASSSDRAELNMALLYASGYISNKPIPPASTKSSLGPYHIKPLENLPSPLTDKCQTSHLAVIAATTTMMRWSSSGVGIMDPLNSAANFVAPYISNRGCSLTINGNYGCDCPIWSRVEDEYRKKGYGDKWAEEFAKVRVGENDVDGWNDYYGMDKGMSGMICGRAMAEWMSRTSQSQYEGVEGNYIKTNTIILPTVPERTVNYLKDMASLGGGKSYTMDNMDGLADIFEDVVDTSLGETRPNASGSVALTPQSKYNQRSEVFYGLYQANTKDYWPGNVKGFKIVFDDTKLSDGTAVQRAVLKDWSGSQYVIDEDGNLIKGRSSAWSSGDSALVGQGGVLSKLPAPDVRKIYTLKANAGQINGGEAIVLGSTSAAAVSTTDLGIDDVADPKGRRLGLLDFIRGYNYVYEGVSSGKTTPMPPKMGESANNGVSLLSYGDCGDKDILTCDYNTLQMVGFYATNDGIFRGYDLTNGKTLFEFMPQQMLPLINKLQKARTLSGKVVKSYGLDTTVVISHDDKNENGIVDGDEKAYAIVSAGKGGPYIYGIDITNKTAPRLAWTIDNTGPFSKLGNTWSVPVAGTIKVGNTMTPVIVFGGGYDTRQDGDKNYDGQANLPQTTDNVGNALYVVDVQTGQLLWSTSVGMNYSIPGQVATVTDSQGLITDLFFGDMGGQLWRFVVHNGKTGNDLLSPGSAADGIVARIAESSANDSRRFYQTPMIYKLPGGKQLSVNIGTGYKAHPLVKNNEDRFYSFRFPLEANPQSNKIITEDDLGLLDPMDTTKGPTKKEYGFMLKLEASKGEKVISNAFADFDKLVFNTYMPNTLSTKACSVDKIGTQRTYYFSLSTGKSLLKTGYQEVNNGNLPLDSVAYCNKNFCTIISSMEMLSEKVEIPDAATKDRRNSTVANKTTWTDYFSPDIK